MFRRIITPLAATAMLAASFALAQDAPAPLKGYLTADTMPDTVRVLPPPPPIGSGRRKDVHGVAVEQSPNLRIGAANRGC